MPTMILNPFKGKNILITNGASGLGLAMAKEFAALKANIAIIAENKEQLGAAQREIEQSGSGIRCIAYACEITDPDTLNDYINMTRYEFGTIDGIVAYIGSSVIGEITVLFVAIILLRLLPLGITGKFKRGV